MATPKRVQRKTEFDAIDVADVLAEINADPPTLPTWILAAHNAGNLTITGRGVLLTTMNGVLRGEATDTIVRHPDGLLPLSPTALGAWEEV